MWKKNFKKQTKVLLRRLLASARAINCGTLIVLTQFIRHTDDGGDASKSRGKIMGTIVVRIWSQGILKLRTVGRT